MGRKTLVFTLDFFDNLFEVFLGLKRYLNVPLSVVISFYGHRGVEITFELIASLIIKLRLGVYRFSRGDSFFCFLNQQFGLSYRKGFRDDFFVNRQLFIAFFNVD